MKYSLYLKENDSLCGFEPTDVTKAMMLKTRKKIMTYGDITAPGLFNIDEQAHDRDSLMVGLIAILEVLGIVALFFSSGTSFFVPKLIIAAIILILDFVVAFQNRSKQNEYCEAVNRIRIAKFLQKLPDNNRYLQDEKTYTTKRDSITKRSKWCLFLLLFLATAKTAIFFWDIKGGISGWFMMKWIFLYATPLLYYGIALLHWEFFGYWYNTYLFEEAIQKDWNEFEKSKNGYFEQLAAHENKKGAKPKLDDIKNRRKEREYNFQVDTGYQTTFEINQLTTLQPDAEQLHELSELRGGGQQIVGIEYRLKSNGVMTDEDVLIIVQRQATKEQGAFLGIQSIRHQLDHILGDHPLSPSNQ